jgi:polyribonucleotide nucleotidyltransferase
MAHFEEIFPTAQLVNDVVYGMKKEVVRKKISLEGIRPDGRKLHEIRPIWCEVGILPRVHGSGVFTRGQTQVLPHLLSHDERSSEAREPR